MQPTGQRLSSPGAAPAPAGPEPTATASATPERRPPIGRDTFVRQPESSEASARATALDASRQLVQERRLDPEAGRNVPSRRIVRNVIDSTSWVWGRNKVEVKKQIEANRPLVARRIEAMTPAQRAQFAAVEKMVGRVAPASTLALQALVLREPALLPGGRPNLDRQDLLEALHRLTLPSTRLAPGIDRHQLVRHLVREIAEPASINQRAWGTCATTSLQIIMAMQDPAELVRLVGGLASGSGSVGLRDGRTLQRVRGTERPEPLEERFEGQTYRTPDERSIPTRLFSAAFMDLGNGDVTYDNRTDRHVEIGLTGGGLIDPEVRSVVEGGTGDATELVAPEEGVPFTPDAPAIDRLRRATAAGVPISAGLEWGEPDEHGEVHGGHEVVVTAIAGDVVHIVNPWGTEETIGLAAFAARVGALHFPAGS